MGHPLQNMMREIEHIEARANGQRERAERAEAKVAELELAFSEHVEKTSQLLYHWRVACQMKVGTDRRKAEVLDAWCSGDWPPKVSDSP